MIAEWLDRGRQPMVRTGVDLTIADVCSRYWAFATKRYARDGKPTPEQFKIKTALKHLLRLYENHYIISFGPMHLKTVHRSMFDPNWARTYINQQVGVIVRMFKWGVTEGLLPAAIHSAIDLVDGLNGVNRWPARQVKSNA
jgi:hypothetical protein